MSFSHDIKMIRNRCLMRQQEFAEALGVSFATVNRWESGKSKPGYKTKKLIQEFCQTKGIDYDIAQKSLEDI